LLGLWWRIAWVFYVLITDSNNAGNFSGGVATFFSGFGLLGCHGFFPVKGGGYASRRYLPIMGLLLLVFKRLFQAIVINKTVLDRDY
jgi:hypothetical protein